MSAMKRKRSPERQLPGPQRLSKSDIEEMVNSKVRVALGELESTRKEQQQKFKALDSDDQVIEDKLKKLQAHIQKVKRRGDAAMAYIRQLKAQGKIVCADQKLSPRPLSTTPPAESFAPGPVISSRNSDSGDGFNDGVFSLIETVSEEQGSGQSKRKTVEGFWRGRRARMPIVDLTAEDILDSPNLSFPEVPVKVEKKDDFPYSNEPPQPTSAPCPPTPPPSVKVEPESPQPVNIKTEETPYDISNPEPPSNQSHPPETGASVLLRDSNESGDNWRGKLRPLPDRPFPTTLPAAAISKNVPQAVTLRVCQHATVQRPEGVYLKWEVDKEDPHAPPMDTYSIYVTGERLDGTFSKWERIGVVEAKPLPIGLHASAIPGYQRLCFTVVGKDKYGRYGPYSRVESIKSKQMTVGL